MIVTCGQTPSRLSFPSFLLVVAVVGHSGGRAEAPLLDFSFSLQCKNPSAPPGDVTVKLCVTDMHTWFIHSDKNVSDEGINVRGKEERDQFCFSIIFINSIGT